MSRVRGTRSSRRASGSPFCPTTTNCSSWPASSKARRAPRRWGRLQRRPARGELSTHADVCAPAPGRSETARRRRSGWFGTAWWSEDLMDSGQHAAYPCLGHGTGPGNFDQDDFVRLAFPVFSSPAAEVVPCDQARLRSCSRRSRSLPDAGCRWLSRDFALQEVLLRWPAPQLHRPETRSTRSTRSRSRWSAFRRATLGW